MESFEAKMNHKEWAVRKDAYDDLVKKFKVCDEASEEFEQYAAILGRMLEDKNQNAQQSAVEALVVFLDRAIIAPRHSAMFLGTLINVCLSLPKSKGHAITALLLCMEIDKADAVVEKLVESIGNRNPKIAMGSCETLKRAIEAFGIKKIPVKGLVKALPKLFESADKAVRSEASALAVEIRRWVGPAAESFFSELRPAQMKDLQTEFAKLPPGVRPVPTRHLRSEGPPPAGAEGDTGAVAVAVSSSRGKADDEEAYDLLPAVSITSRLSPNWADAVGATAWQDRKAVAEALLAAASVPRLSDDIGEVLPILRMLVADNNVTVQTVAAKTVTVFCKALRSTFAVHVAGFVKLLLEGFKQKKDPMTQAVHAALDALSALVSPTEGFSLASAALSDKTPVVRKEALLWVARLADMARPRLPRKIAVDTIALITPVLDERDAEMRRAGCECFAHVAAAVGTIGQNLIDALEPKKAERISSIFVSLADASPTSMAPAPTPAPASARPSTAPPAQTDQRSSRASIAPVQDVRRRPAPPPVVAPSPPETSEDDADDKENASAPNVPAPLERRPVEKKPVAEDVPAVPPTPRSRIPTGAAPVKERPTKPAAMPCSFSPSATPIAGRVVLRRVGQQRGGVVVPIPSSVDELFSSASKKLGVEAVQVWLWPSEALVDDASLLQNNDVLCLATAADAEAASSL